MKIIKNQSQSTSKLIEKNKIKIQEPRVKNKNFFKAMKENNSNLIIK